MKKLLSVALVSLAVPLGLGMAGCSHPRAVVVYAPPPAFSEAAQQGYRNGVDAAQRDMHKGLRPDVARHPRFNNPRVPPPLQEEYRRGFREGYQRVFAGA
ncbi:MAG: hypothetical protein WA414_08655 [Acidobacteriaceae bacterium]